MHGKNIGKTFSGLFFRRHYRSNSTKTRLDTALLLIFQSTGHSSPEASIKRTEYCFVTFYIMY